jgi:GNAT superfamily N-acetyltransferase
MLRSMVPEDAEAVAAVVRAAFAAQSVPTDPPASALRLTAAYVEAHLAGGGGGAVAEIAGELAGSVLWEVKDGGLYVSRVAVVPTFRRRGIARALLAAAEDAARGLHLPFLHLATRLVLADNRRLFSACGFVETEWTAHPGYAESTSVTMVKRLG